MYSGQFHAAGRPAVFARPMSELANCMVALDDLGDREIEELSCRLAELNSWDARLDLVERFVTMRLARAGAIDPAIDWAIAALMRSGGQTASARSRQTRMEPTSVGRTVSRRDRSAAKGDRPYCSFLRRACDG
jgi:hypothetical protein